MDSKQSLRMRCTNRRAKGHEEKQSKPRARSRGGSVDQSNSKGLPSVLAEEGVHLGRCEIKDAVKSSLATLMQDLNGARRSLRRCAARNRSALVLIPRSQMQSSSRCIKARKDL